MPSSDVRMEHTWRVDRSRAGVGWLAYVGGRGCGEQRGAAEGTRTLGLESRG